MKSYRSLEIHEPEKRSKVLKYPVVIYLQGNETTDRFVLWIIANAPYAFNMYFFTKFVNENEDLAEPDSWLSKHLKTVQSLKARGFIKQDENLDWHITFKGQLFRLTTHPQWIFIQLLIAAFLAFIVAYAILLINRSTQATKAKEESSREKPITTPYDSFKYNSSQTAPFNLMDSSLIDSNMTKANPIETSKIKTQIIKTAKQLGDTSKK